MTGEHRISPRPAGLLASFIGPERAGATQAALDELAAHLGRRRLVNLTSDDRRKGGVYEILRTTLPYLRGSGIDAHWVDVVPDPRARAALEFFHVLAHGVGDPNWKQDLPTHRRHVHDFSEGGKALVRDLLRPDDVVVCHDTQTALLAQHCVGDSRLVLWRAHVGSSYTNAMTTAYWNLFGPALTNLAATIFYTDAYVPSILRDRSAALLPSIDPSIVKNQAENSEGARAWLAKALSKGSVTRYGGQSGMFSPETTLAVQLSRWDPLKQMPLVTRAFCLAAAGSSEFRGVVAGPLAESASEKRELNRCLDVINDAPRPVVDAVQVVVIQSPGSQRHDEVVRHLQSAADIIVQASLREGFGLTVTEAMLKGAAVVAADTGGIPMQIRHLENGVLMPETADEADYALVLAHLSRDVDLRSALGRTARVDAHTAFTVDRHLREGGRILGRALRRHDSLGPTGT